MTDSNASNASNASTFTSNNGRDAGKTFQIDEVPPLEMAAFILRLLSAIRLSGVDELMSLVASVRSDEDQTADAAMAGVLRLLAGCDPLAVKSLITDALTFVQIAPDPKHAGMFRALRDDDIKEMATLGEVLAAFARVNVAT